MQNNNTPSSKPTLASDVTLPASTPAPTSSETAPEAWEEFLEEDADCCGGCNHKPR